MTLLGLDYETWDLILGVATPVITFVWLYFTYRALRINEEDVKTTRQALEEERERSNRERELSHYPQFDASIAEKEELSFGYHSLILRNPSEAAALNVIVYVLAEGFLSSAARNLSKSERAEVQANMLHHSQHTEQLRPMVEENGLSYGIEMLHYPTFPAQRQVETAIPMGEDRASNLTVLVQFNSILDQHYLQRFDFHSAEALEIIDMAYQFVGADYFGAEPFPPFRLRFKEDDYGCNLETDAPETIHRRIEDWDLSEGTLDRVVPLRAMETLPTFGNDRHSWTNLN